MKTYKFNYREIITHVNIELDINWSRKICGEKTAKAYADQFNKRNTAEVKEYFTRDCGMYHEVRNLLENIKTDDFQEILNAFKKLYPIASKDWKSALECGLLVKAKSREGNFFNKPYIYKHPIAIELQKHSLNTIKEIIPNILNS